MRAIPHPNRPGGFTRVEAFIALGAVAVLALIALGLIGPVGPNHHRKSERIRCINNLKQVGLSFRILETDRASTNGFLSGVTEASQYYAGLLALSNVLVTPKLLVCPTDRSARAEATSWEEFAASGVRNRGISYFATKGATETRPQVVLFGDRSFEAKPPLPAFSYRAPRAVMGWTGTNAEVAAASLSITPGVMHQGTLQAAMADGSVQQLTSQRVSGVLAGTGAAGLPIIQPGTGPD